MTPSKKHLAEHLAIGFTAGLTVAVLGAIKDVPHEGFKPLTFLRSPLIATLEAPVIGKAFKNPHPVLIYLSTIATERITTETYKVIRAQPAGKFSHGEWNMPRGFAAEGRLVPKEEVDPMSGVF